LLDLSNEQSRTEEMIVARTARKRSLRDRLRYWTPNRESTFSLGVRVSSDILEPEDLRFIGDAFDDSWEPLKIRKHRYPKPRPGSRFDTHLNNDDVAKASSNVVAACQVLDLPEFANLRKLDPKAVVDVHAMQNIADVGRIIPTQLSPEAVAALAGVALPHDWFDIDQYGAEGHPLVEATLRPITRRLSGRRTSHTFAFTLDGVIVARFASEPVDDVHRLADRLLEWLALNTLPVGSTFVSGQLIRVPGVQGIGFGVESPVFDVLASHGLGLELRTRTRFGLRPIQPTGSRSISSTTPRLTP